MQGMAGGLAGGFLGSLLFGSRGYAQPMGSTGGGGFGLLDLIIVGALIYFGFKFYRRWRAPRASTGYYEEGGPSRFEGPPGTDYLGSQPYPGSGGPDYSPPYDEVDRGFQQIRRSDPSFSEAKFLETVQDIFFRIQASWMHRSIATMGSMLTPEMAQFFVGEIDGLKQAGRINKLENIAVRKVEPSEVWQEDGKDYVTVLFTANLLDYTVDEKTGQVIEGDEINPVKFQEFWTFCRDTGSGQWQLSAINQPK
jgi:predicted lipid-binding transport protein (Tim44 family)